MLINSLCQPVELGSEIGKGGEGSVFEVLGHPTLVAKVYHHRPLPRDTVAKLEAMVACGSAELEAISAWPHSLLYDPQRRQPCGVLLPRLVESHHLHELYGTYNRRRHFPDVKWHHLLLGARNVAAAFDSLHTAGIIVGDVNQGNLMVDPRMCVRFIDCDSFQICTNGHFLPCPVGTPHFTPPELQSTKLRDVTRTINHDCFGMAILIFHLLFVGRHPFAGRYRGSQELTIEKAIADRRFAFSKNRAATRVDPPPASLLIEDLPESLAGLFELAFRARGGQPRPTAGQWCQVLQAALRQCKTCAFDASHIFYQQLKQCPWCRIEEEGGPAFFVTGGATSIISQDRLEVLDRRIDALKRPAFPDLAPRRLTIPTTLPPKPLSTQPKISSPDAAAILLVVSAVCCLLPAVSGWFLLAGTVGCVVSGGFLLLSSGAKGRRIQVAALLGHLTRIQNRLLDQTNAITAAHRKLKANFENALDEFQVEIDHYRTDSAKLEDVLVYQRATQKNQFLARQLIHDHFAHIPGLSPSMCAMLQSFGVDSALDVDQLHLSAIPNMSGTLKIELLRWRQELESAFVYNPDHGVKFSDVQSARDAAMRRFKAAQARRVLLGAKQLQALVDTARYELQRELADYDETVSRGQEVALKLRDLESSRRSLERLLNRSLATILTTALAAPVVGLLLWLLFG